MPAGFKTVRMISVASRSASDCKRLACLNHVLFHCDTGLTDLLLGALAGFGHGGRTCLLRSLPTGILRLEYHQPRFAQTILVFLGLGLGGGDIGARLKDGTFGPLAPLFEDALQRVADQSAIEGIKQQE